MLDGILAKIAARTDTADTGTWIGLLSSDEAAPIRDKALASLVERGILERREERFLWAFPSVRNPTLDRSFEDGIKSRIEVVLSDEIPDPRDVALISLVDACEILQELFPDGEIERVAPRIQLLRKMDLVGREVAGKIADIQRTIIRAARARAAWQRWPRCSPRASASRIGTVPASSNSSGSTGFGSNGPAIRFWGSASPGWSSP